MTKAQKNILSDLSAEDYTNWRNSSELRQEDFPIWALKNNKISQNQYMEWAIQHYKIPFVTDSFFYNITINQQFWNRIKNLANWNQDFLPIYEWDSIIFVGCLQPPKETQDKNIVPVLVTPKNLNFFWKKIQTFSKIGARDTTSASPRGTISSGTRNTTSASPRGTTSSGARDTTSASPRGTTSSGTRDTTSASPRGTTSSGTRDTTAPTNKSAFLLQETEQKTHSEFLSNPLTLLQTMVRNTALTQLKMFRGSDVVSQVAQISEKYFIGIIIFSFQNNQFTPIEWSDSMAGPATPINIEKPSIFKMIVKSKSPYHGFIVDNEIHKQFFTPWGFEALPTHVTFIPIFDNSKNIIGAFMGIASKPIHQKHLHQITKWAASLSKVLEEKKVKKSNVA